MPAPATPMNTALVSFSVTSADDYPSGTNFTCTSAAGAQIAAGPAGTNTLVSHNFPAGTTEVTCVATDCLGQTSDAATLTVTVASLEAAPTTCIPDCADCSVSGEEGRCDECDPGMFLQLDGTCANTCPPGTGGASCTQCPKGMWSAGGDETTPQPACQSCSSALTTASAGATSLGACTLCRPGRGGATCRACAAGTWSHGGTQDDPTSQKKQVVFYTKVPGMS
ncbi:MAG: hypothetical protein J3K34DRAFT_523174, partial [Monoraphidium minutum]